MAYVAEFKRVENEKKLYEFFVEKTVTVNGETKSVLERMGVYSEIGLNERIAKATEQISEWVAMRDTINDLEEK
jgi:hypothetical protein